MLEISFHKYHGTGNDFVMIDNRNGHFPKEDVDFIAQLCHRRFGIGADGLILLENSSTTDFTMVYFNSDGNLSSMCGNGGRCIVHFSEYLGIISDSTVFSAIDGEHAATIRGDWVSLKMADVEGIHISGETAFLDTGSPHHVSLVSDLKEFDVFSQGRKIRNELYGESGANVNFVEPRGDVFDVRTYERGVEDETLSCGTGVTAVALAMAEMNKTAKEIVEIGTRGGNLQVRFKRKGASYFDIFLEGPAKRVFSGTWKWKH